MLIDWLSYTISKAEKNEKIFNSIYNESDFLKSRFLVCGTRITNRPKEGLVDIDMSSKALSNYKFNDIRKIIFYDYFHVRRLDIAYDDRNGLLEMENIWNLIENNSIVSQFKNFTKLESIERTKKRTFHGTTFYGGKRSSHSFIRIYDKYQESYKTFKNETLTTAKNRIRDLKNHKNFIRVEIELKQKNADHIFRKIISEEFDPKKYLFKLLDFKNPESVTKRIERKETIDFWKIFLDGIEKEKLGLPKPFWSLETLEKWINKQIAPSLYGFTKHKSENELSDLIKKAGERFTESQNKKFYKSKRKIHLTKLIKKIGKNHNENSI